MAELERALAEPEDPPPKRRGRRLSYSSSSSASNPSSGSESESESEDPVKRRLSEIRKNRKKAEENRVTQMQERRKRIRKEQEMEERIVEVARELDQMTSMLHDMGRWFAQFEREDTVEQNLCHLPVSNDFMDQLERHLFSS